MSEYYLTLKHVRQIGPKLKKRLNCHIAAKGDYVEHGLRHYVSAQMMHMVIRLPLVICINKL